MGDGFDFGVLCAALFFDDFEFTFFCVAPDLDCECFLAATAFEPDELFDFDVLAFALLEAPASFVPATLVLLLLADVAFCSRVGFVVTAGVDGVGLASVRFFASASTELGRAWLTPDAISRTTW